MDAAGAEVHIFILWEEVASLLSKHCGVTTMKACTSMRARTHRSNIRGMRNGSLWCFCGYFPPIQASGATLTTGCLSDIKEWNQLRGHSVCSSWFLCRVFVLPLCPLSSFILFFLSNITAHKGLLWAPGARDDCALHNKERTSHM